MESQYVHGTHPEEQRRLSLLNGLLNPSSLRALRLERGDRVLDVGSGLAQLSRGMARRVGPEGRVVGVERDAAQLAEARRLAAVEGEEGLVDLRQGSVEALPLGDEEWGSFDVVHCRFVLEHLRDPQAAVDVMVSAARPGGRLVLEDDDHELLQLHPAAPRVAGLWKAYYETYRALGNDPLIGRRLPTLLHRAGAPPRRSDMLFFGSCAGDPLFAVMVANFAGVLEGARQAILASSAWSADMIDAALAELRAWTAQPDAALWYATCWAEGVRPGEARRRTVVPARAEVQPRDSLLEFLAESARDLSSTLRLEEVFQKIAARVAKLLDAHLFCVMLWNAEKELLEHSYSLKFGRHILQEGGFPLGVGLSGSAAAERRALRIANVQEDPRYVRFRHPEVEIRSELAVPLICDGRLVGVLDLESTELGAFTHEHEQGLSALASHIAAALENARLFEAVRAEEKRLERELATAREMQRGLLPQVLPRTPTLELGAAHRPARELSGDFYDVQTLGGGRLIFAVGDVAGKGSAAALLGSLSVGLLRALVLARKARPARLLAALNERLRDLDLEHRFVALVLGVYDPKTRGLHLANAGIPAPLRLHGDEISRLDLRGVPLGGLAQARYEEVELRLDPGDVLIFVTDGIDDAGHERGAAFGAEALERAVAAVATEEAGTIAEAVLEAAADHVAPSGGRQSDDRTVLVVRAR